MDAYKPDPRNFEGFEIWLNSSKMKFKMHSRIVLLLSAVTAAIFSASVVYTFGDKTDIAVRWGIARAIAPSRPDASLSFKNPDGSLVKTRAIVIATTPWVEQAAREELTRLGWNLAKVALAVFLFYPVILNIFKNKSRQQSNKRYVRGAKLDTLNEFERQARARNERIDLPFGTARMPVAAEPKHCFIVGRPGTGKTVCLSAILKRLKEQKARAIVYDNKGDYLAKFYNPEEDLIFNPLDRRSLGWTLFNEVETYMDIDAIAASLIPPSVGLGDPFWAEAARALFSGILHKLYRDEARTNGDIWKMITSEGASIAAELKLTRGGEAGHRFIENPESNQALGVFAVLMQHSKCFEYMAGWDGDFSVKRWLQSGKGMIYITNYADVRDTLKPVLTLFIDLLGRKLLSMPDAQDRRIFFLLDEFNTLQRMSTILDLLTLSRSKGGCVFLGVQDFGKIDKIYSKDLRQSIVNACGSSVTFAVSDQAAKTASDNIGETEYVESERSYSMGVKAFRDGANLAERKKREMLMLPSDITNLRDLVGIVKFPNYNYLVSRWHASQDSRRPREIHPDRNESFQLRPDLLMSSILDEWRKVKQMVVENVEIQFEDE